MTVESADDRAAFLDDEDFAIEATYTTAASVSAAITGIHDAPHLSRDFGDGAPLSDVRRTFLCRTADLPNGAVGGDAGDTLTIAGTAYRVAGHEPDGTGMTLLILAK